MKTEYDKVIDDFWKLVAVMLASPEASLMLYTFHNFENINYNNYYWGKHIFGLMLVLGCLRIFRGIYEKNIRKNYE